MNIFDAKTLLDEIKRFSYRGRTPWERKFLRSITDQVESKQKLSVKQGDCLQKIYRSASDAVNAVPKEALQ